VTQQQYIIKRKLNILDLGEQLGNVSLACKNLGISRQHFYDIKNALAEEGIEGLLEKSRRTNRPLNRVPADIESKLLEHTLLFPAWGQVRMSNELKKINYIISPGGVRSVWIRHNLQSIPLRLKRLEEWSRDKNNILTESQVTALEQAKEEKEVCGEIETHHPGFLLGQDTYYVGYIKGVGKIYQQTGIDTFSNVGFAKLYNDKTSLTAADFINDKVLPFFDSEMMTLLRVLTDRGLEYCGPTETHKYELFLHLNDIEHTKTKARHPQTNGCVERLNQIIQNEFYAVAFRKKIYTSLEQMQHDLDKFIYHYNVERTNQGKHCKGRTPMQTFTEGYELYKKYVIEKSEVTNELTIQ
jgi:hypothetical protein